MQYPILKSKIALLSLALLFTSSPALAKKFYKCTNAEGELVYQQVACDSNISQETVNVFTPPKHHSQLGSKLMGEGEYIPEGNEPAIAGKMMFQSRLSNVIALLTPIKMQMQQFYIMNGQWPEKPQDLGLNQENLKSVDIKEVLFGDQGAIVASLNEHFGTGKRVVLAPQLVMDGTTMEWQCMANFPVQSMTAMGMKMCESRNIR
ncbi:hypothetical protein A3194_05940 [Candidatus Thiodiazotropha endoloripes]|uniref:pilin n=1 Tax=Candidatus Thiodiazotropha endoloripes TaxID=1818881 RepID=UPI00083D1DAF|nr:pilin [Candidatus Thiodiazotropha endoloripes]ODB94183.1 hypothetical protein A3194_05940 [Candidatus Thiodiazotropha endoloripes]